MSFYADNMDKTALVKDVDEQPQSSSRWYRKPDGPHQMADIRASQPKNGSVLTEYDDDHHVRDVDGEDSPTPHSAWYRKPRPERTSSIEPDLELAEQSEEKARRICGCSRPTFIIVLFFVVVVVAAAIAGGVAGSQASRNKGSEAQSTAS